MSGEGPFGWEFVPERTHRRPRRFRGLGTAVLLTVAWIGLCCLGHEFVSWMVG